MMEKAILQEINILKFVPRNVQWNITHTDVFSYDESKKLKWVQKICFWILEKIECFYFEEIKKTKIERISYDPKDILKKIFSHYQNIVDTINSFHYKNIWTDYGSIVLYMGPEDFDELNSHCKILSSANLTVPITGLWGEYTFEYQGMKLPIVVVPYMKGMIILPKKGN